MSDLAHETPIAARDHFKVASLTKTYTATVVLQLVGEGKLSLDDSVQRRLPGVVPDGSKITIRQLLNHTSGLADFESDLRYRKPYLAGNFAHYGRLASSSGWASRINRCSHRVPAGRTRTRTTSWLS
jgi:D-alanyl-D-alanine carboxypeptidase